jgi:hypothetical protein
VRTGNQFQWEVQLFLYKRFKASGGLALKRDEMFRWMSTKTTDGYPEIGND